MKPVWQKLASAALKEVRRSRDLAEDPFLFARMLGFKPDPWQEKFLQSKAQFKLLNCSRQIGKSETTAIKALHLALFVPESMIILVSPGERQSGEIFRKVIGWLNVHIPQRKLPEENKTTLELPNDSRIVALPGKESTTRSFSSVSLLVADEASRIPDPLYKAVQPMLLNSEGNFIGLSSPWGKRGWFYHEWIGEEGVKDDWERYEVPVTQIERIMSNEKKRAFLDREKRRDPRWFNQEYLCKFVELEDGLFPDALIEEAFDPTVIPLFTGDPGMTPDEGEVESLKFSMEDV